MGYFTALPASRGMAGWSPPVRLDGGGPRKRLYDQPRASSGENTYRYVEEAFRNAGIDVLRGSSIHEMETILCQQWRGPILANAVDIIRAERKHQLHW